jgi:signal peptidase I
MQMNAELPPEQAPQTVPPVPAIRVITDLVRDILETVLPALLIVLVVNAFLAQATRVEGQSMEPNLHNNQRLVIEKISYRFHSPRRGDIVVLKSPNWVPIPFEQRVVAWCYALLSRDSTVHVPDPLIKRIVGLPGEMIAIHDGHVYINEQILVEPYIQQATFGDVPAHVISSGCVFVLGDNRGASNDSRSFGEVALADIIGRAWLCYWPPGEIGTLH